MSRHGQCRCGTVLKFRKRHGYKRRCPACGKVVRLQADNLATIAPTELPDDSHLFEVEGERRDVSATCTPVQAQCTWQWLTVAAGLFVWVGALSVLAWWWWQ